MTEPEKPKRQIQKRDAATITRGLLALVATNGNTRQASKALAADEIEVSHETLHYWKTRSHKDEYERLREQELPKIVQRQADAHRALEERQLETSLAGTELIAANLPHMEHKDLINAVGKMDIGTGIHAEKAQLLSGQPTHRSERTVEELLRGLNGRGLQLGEKRQEADGTTVERVAVVGPGEPES